MSITFPTNKSEPIEQMQTMQRELRERLERYDTLRAGLREALVPEAVPVSASEEAPV